MGVVYLIRDDDSGAYKVGCTGALQERIGSLVRAIRRKRLRFVWAIATNHAGRLEDCLKKRWMPWHVIGEWFDLPESEVAEFRRVIAYNWHGSEPVNTEYALRSIRPQVTGPRRKYRLVPGEPIRWRPTQGGRPPKKVRK